MLRLVGATVVLLGVVLEPKSGGEEMPKAVVGGWLALAGMLNVGVILAVGGGRLNVRDVVEGARPKEGGEVPGAVELKADCVREDKKPALDEVGAIHDPAIPPATDLLSNLETKSDMK